MTEIGRAALGQIFASTEYKAWASRNTLDAGKIALEYQGKQRPKAGSKYAQGFQTLCRENPPAGNVLPPPVIGSELAAVWRLDAAFTEGGLSNFGGDSRARAFATGWRAVYVQLLHTAYAAANEDELPVFTREGWTLVGWGTYGQGSDPTQDGRDAAAICRRLGLKAWKANGEAWTESQYQWKTQAFLDGWKENGAPCPLGWSVLSSDTSNFRREWAYETALRVSGADIDPQVYGATYPSYTVGAALGTLSKVPVPVARTTMTFDVNGDGNGPFGDYLTWPGPRRLWRPDRATVATWDRLQR